MKRMMMLAACVAAVVLSACGSKEEASVKATAPATAPVASVQLSKALPKADPSVPLTQYQELSSDKLTYLNLALSAPPVDYEKVAWATSAEYRATFDAFKKKDLLAVLKPQIDARLAETKRTGRYLYVDFQPGAIYLDHYNLDKKAFPISGLSLGNYRLSNADAFKYLPMSDENKAREVEAAIAKGVAYKISANEGSLAVSGRFPTISRLYVFAQGMGADGGPIQFQIVKLVIKTTDGQPFAEM